MPTGRACCRALKSLIEDSLTHKEVAVCAFLDIQGAFANTAHEAVNASLARRGLDAIISRWIKALLASRRAMATIGGQSSTVSTTRGCPQEGVLSPLLWSLLVDGLLERLTRRGIFFQGYADDIVIIARAKYEETLRYHSTGPQYDQRIVQGSRPEPKTKKNCYCSFYK